MKHHLFVLLAVVSTFLFIACEKSNLEELGEKSPTAQENQQAILNNLEHQKEALLAAASTYKHTPSSSSRTKQTSDLAVSIGDTTSGISFLVDGASIYDIPDCTVTITDNGDFNTYTITAIDRFEEVDNVVTYTLELDITKADGTFVPRPFSMAWGQFSAWPVPNFFLFGYWSAEIVAEDEEKIVIAVPLKDPFSIYRTTIDVETSHFESENLEGVVRIVASKQ